MTLFEYFMRESSQRASVVESRPEIRKVDLRPALSPPDLALIEPMSISIPCNQLRPVDHRLWRRQLPLRPIRIVRLCKLSVSILSSL